MRNNPTFALSDGRTARAVVKNPDGRGLAVLLPGLNYGCDKPLLAELSGLLQERGLKVLEFALPRYTDAPDFKAMPRERQLATFAADGRALVAQLADWAGDDGPQVLAGKSLGSMVLGGMAEAGLPAAARVIWLTPSLRNTPLLGQMRAAGRPAFSLIGSRDPAVGITRSLPYGQIADLVHLEVGGMDHTWHHMEGERETLMGLARAVVGMRRWLDRVL